MSNLTETQQDNATKEFAKLLEESFEVSQINEGKIVKGTIVSIESDIVIIDVGLKTDGRISINEFVSKYHHPMFILLFSQLSLRMQNLSIILVSSFRAAEIEQIVCVFLSALFHFYFSVFTFHVDYFYWSSKYSF